MEELAEAVHGKIGIVATNDSARSSFTVAVGESLLAVDQDLNVIGRWASPPGRGWHATWPARGLALISGADEVCLLDHRGQVRWHYRHVPWSGAFGSGCTWFDATGQPCAVIPDDSYEHCLVLRLDLDSGQLLAAAQIEAAPAGINPVHHPDGWVGLSEGEGQDAARAWWVRPAGHATTVTHEHAPNCVGHQARSASGDVPPSRSDTHTMCFYAALGVQEARAEARSGR